MNGLEFTRNQKLALAAIAGLMVVCISVKLIRNATSPVYGGITLTEAGQGDGTAVTTSGSDSMSSSEANGGRVVFQVAGCVNSPNVYTLARGSRIVDAIRVAGGAKAGADLQSLNLAAKIEDGSRIFVPAAGQVAPTAAAASSTPAQSSVTGTGTQTASKTSGAEKLHNPGEGTVHLNTADVTELQRLPGVGPSTAQAILDYRKQIGRFTSPDQIDEVKGIGPKKLERMRPFIAL